MPDTPRRPRSASRRRADTDRRGGAAAPTGPTDAGTHYWRRRLVSPEFKDALVAIIAGELRALSKRRVRDLVAMADIRRAIRGPEVTVRREALADIVIQVNRRILERLERQHTSIAHLLPPATLTRLEALLAEAPAISADAEAFVAELVQQEFTRRLFTDLVFTAMVSFYQRVNPLFGALALHAVERQIKSFIDLFMPMLQKQATTFMLDRSNRALVAEFARVLAQELLRQPLRHYAAMLSATQRARVEDMLQQTVGSGTLDSVWQRAALAVATDVLAVVGDRRVGELLALDDEADRIARRLVEMWAPALAKDAVVRLLAAEVARAPQR